MAPGASQETNPTRSSLFECTDTCHCVLVSTLDALANGARFVHRPGSVRELALSTLWTSPVALMARVPFAAAATQNRESSAALPS